MVGNSPENISRPALDDIVKIAVSAEYGKYVALKFGLFGGNEDAVREAYGEYIAGREIGEPLVEKAETKFFRLTGFSASDIYKKAQQAHLQLEQKNVMRPLDNQ